ncbi:MAG TPA: hypothetical protein VN415_02455 [Dehalococcoidia bacterium]|nr:hypothetical protein [Dehalococcoidia bacterium]
MAPSFPYAVQCRLVKHKPLQSELPNGFGRLGVSDCFGKEAIRAQIVAGDHVLFLTTRREYLYGE